MEPHAELDALGILRQVRLPQELAWMDKACKQMLVSLALAGEDGLSKGAFLKRFKDGEETVLTLEVRGLVTWESDKQGRPAYLVLTWKGKDASDVLLAQAKNESSPTFFDSPYHQE